MRIITGTILAVALMAAAAGAGRADSYIVGVLTDQLEIYGSDGSGPIYKVAQDDITGPIRVTDEIGQDWLEIVVQGEYYRVRRADVQVSRAKTAGGTAMGPAAGQGVRLGFGGN